MTMDRETDRLIREWLLDGPSVAPPDLLASAFAEIPAKHARRRRLAGTRSFLMISRLTSVAVSAVAIVAVVAVAAFVLPRAFPPGNGIGGSVPTPSPSASATAVPATPTPTDTPVPTVGPMGLCNASNLTSAITSWTGAAGSRIAEVSLHNTGSSSCETSSLDQPQLIGPDGSILIDGSPTSSPTPLVMNPGATLRTMIRASDYCGPAVTAGPVTVAFVLGDGAGRVVADPWKPTDMSGLPPCNSAPGTPGSIEMQPWAP